VEVAVLARHTRANNIALRVALSDFYITTRRCENTLSWQLDLKKEENYVEQSSNPVLETQNTFTDQLHQPKRLWIDLHR